MRKFPCFLFLLSALLLSACSSSSPSLSSASSSVEEELHSSFPLGLNGDLYGVTSGTDYNDVTHYQDVQTLIRRYENGESVAFLFTSLSCSHCETWKSTFVPFVLNSKIEIIHFEKGSLSDAVYRDSYLSLQSYFNNVDQIQGATPTLFLARKGVFHYLGAAGLSYLGLQNAFNYYGEASQLRLFSSYERYSAYLKDNPDALSYLLDRTTGSLSATFYGESLYPLAKTSSKPLAVLDYSAMDETNQKALLVAYSLSEFAPLVLQKAIRYDISKESEKASALSLFASYFA